MPRNFTSPVGYGDGDTYSPLNPYSAVAAMAPTLPEIEPLPVGGPADIDNATPFAAVKLNDWWVLNNRWDASVQAPVVTCDNRELAVYGRNGANQPTFGAYRQTIGYWRYAVRGEVGDTPSAPVACFATKHWAQWDVVQYSLTMVWHEREYVTDYDDVATALIQYSAATPKFITDTQGAYPVSAVRGARAPKARPTPDIPSDFTGTLDTSWAGFLGGLIAPVDYGNVLFAALALPWAYEAYFNNRANTLRLTRQIPVTNYGGYAGSWGDLCDIHTLSQGGQGNTSYSALDNVEDGVSIGGALLSWSRDIYGGLFAPTFSVDKQNPSTTPQTGLEEQVARSEVRVSVSGTSAANGLLYVPGAASYTFVTRDLP
jgi:hypothetical protein